LTGLAGRMPITWIACARTEDDLNWGQGNVTVEAGRKPATLGVSFLSPDADAYDGYYNIIANPLLWFLQHSMWDLPLAPVIDRKTWEAWTGGYVAVNQLFADAIAEQVRANAEPTMVMLQDYHLYLTPRMIRSQMRPAERPSLLHFVHIPWPGTEYWRILPPAMRLAILDGLCAVDLLGFQTHADSLNFMRTCQAYLPRASVKFGKGRVWYRNHATHVREFPISIDVKRLRQFAQSPQVADLRTDLETQLAGQKIILRIERTEPSKNIVRGFLAFEEMLETHPEHQSQVTFVAILVPSRLEVREYRAYLDALMAAAGRVNARFGTGEWEPIRLLMGESYPRAVASMQIYDVLLVNSIADGMNLVAKEGPIANRRAGVLVLSEGTGAREELESGAIVISPCDVHATAEALHQGLTMAKDERQRRARLLRDVIEKNDITTWLDNQLDAAARLKLKGAIV
ncbi:MAG: trehalose-6-phosphate synthase, partial [Anaerolineae bacterium]|nr:trehalose-6-phosphate synthase [Anaerolineae bacterium]